MYIFPQAQMLLVFRNWPIFLFFWNVRFHDAACDVRFPPLLVYVLWKDCFAVRCLEGWLRQTLLRRVVTALDPIQPLFVDDLWCSIDEETGGSLDFCPVVV